MILYMDVCFAFSIYFFLHTVDSRVGMGGVSQAVGGLGKGLL